jgi:hypothetical protein
VLEQWRWKMAGGAALAGAAGGGCASAIVAYLLSHH